MKTHEILFLLFSALIIGIAYYILFVKKKPANVAVVHQAEPVIRAPEEEEEKQQNNEVGIRRRIQRGNDNDDDSNDEDEIDNQQQQREGNQTGKESTTDGVTNKKMLHKAAKKNEKRERREAIEYMIKKREKEEEEKSKKILEEELKAQEEEKKKEEFYQKLIEEQRKKEEEEYNKWKDQFEVEASGDINTKLQEELEKKEKFLQYIKTNKVVLFEDLSAQFQFTTSETLDKIKDLEKEKLLNGIIDDRGKYIYITEEEMTKCMSYLAEKGRASRAELLNEWSRIIKLEPLNQKVIKDEFIEKELEAEISGIDLN